MYCHVNFGYCLAVNSSNTLTLVRGSLPLVGVTVLLQTALSWRAPAAHVSVRQCFVNPQLADHVEDRHVGSEEFQQIDMARVERQL